MSRSALKVLLLLLVTAAGWGGLWLYEGRGTVVARETQAKADAEQRGERLRGIARRLETDGRVARVIVTDQQTGPEGERGFIGRIPRTTLLWLEYTRDRQDLLPARRFVIEGKAARVNGKVIRFRGAYAEENEPLAAQSLLLFKSISGDTQAEKDAPPIDPPGGVPDAYKGRDPRLAEREAPYWRDFWKLAEDAQFRAAKGVQVLEPQATLPEGFERGKVYTVILSADGQLSIQAEQAEADLLKAIEEAAKRGG
jgi:hypothetical protein